MRASAVFLLGSYVALYAYACERTVDSYLLLQRNNSDSDSESAVS